MQDYQCNQLSEALKAGAQHQESTVKQIMWDDVQQLKKDIQRIDKILNHIQEFLKKEFP